MYSNGFVVCVVVNGKILREGKGGRINVPFGREYTIRLRNKNKRRALAKIFIDGENVSGTGWIVEAGAYEDIERRQDSPTKFQFVSQDSEQAVDAGKNGDPHQKNGVIQVRWLLEKPTPVYHHGDYVPKIWREPLNPGVWPYYPPRRMDIYLGDQLPMMGWSANQTSLSCADSVACSANIMQKSLVSSLPVSSRLTVSPIDGCTVEGSHSNQNIEYGYMGELETEETIISLLMVGGVDHLQEESPSTASKFCSNCGQQRRIRIAKFCHGCGTKF